MQTKHFTWNHYNLVDAPVPIGKAMAILVPKAEAEKEWDSFQNLPAWGESKVRIKENVIHEEKVRNTKIRFATLMDFCHLKHSELAERLQTYNG